MSTLINPSPDDQALAEPLAVPTFSDPSSGLWQTAILAIGRRVATAVGANNQLASDATSALAEALDFDFCGVAKAPADGEVSILLNAVKFGVHVPTETLSLPDRPDDSLVAFAMASGRLVATPDVSQEKRFHDLILRRCQAQSALACPLRSNGASYGSILLASLTPRVMSASEFACVETICHLVAAALARSRTEQLLDEAQVSVEVLEAIDASVVMLDADRRLLQINRSCEELTGFSPADVKQREFCSAFVAAGEESTVSHVFDQILSDGLPRQFEARLLRKHGDERRVEWRFRRLHKTRPGVLVGTGVDVTAKCELEARIARIQPAEVTPSQPAASIEPNDDDVAAMPDPGGSANRRRFPRRPYPYVQRMAPIRNGQTPTLDHFYEVECRDISAGGFSYYAAEKPTETDIVVAFGAQGMETFLTARIMHARPAVRKGRSMFAVGCQYTGRRQYPK
jgi:PAS domain S-box-containing protein